MLEPSVTLPQAVPRQQVPSAPPRPAAPPADSLPRPWRGTRRIQFHVLSFEGPDPYSRAGGIASRVWGLSQTLAAIGFETHLWFVGDPQLPGHESRGGVRLHRWCQWISQYHPAGVYDGEEGKWSDYARSLPPFLLGTLVPHLAHGGRAVVLAEEWQTADAVLHLDWLLRSSGLRNQVQVLWNANNVFGFERIDWGRLAAAAAITTVSRYMKHKLAACGVESFVIPNGLAAEAFLLPDLAASVEFRSQLAGRLVLAKVARYDPDKRWLSALDIVAELRERGGRPLLVARGGMEAHGADVQAHAAALGLRVEQGAAPEAGPRGLLAALCGAARADVLELRSPLDPGSRRLLFREADAVLANSGHEPFGLVGLEAMAAGGVACTGCSGEDYAVAGRNALVLQTADPGEFVRLFRSLRANPVAERAMRRAARATAEEYAWPVVVGRHLLPRVGWLAAVG